MLAGDRDFTIDKGARWYKEIQLVNENGEPVSLIGMRIRCIVKESTATDTLTFDMTEFNGRVQVINDSQGNVALYLTAEETLSVKEDWGIYRLVQVDENYPEQEIQRLLQGNIEYRK